MLSLCSIFGEFSSIFGGILTRDGSPIETINQSTSIISLLRCKNSKQVKSYHLHSVFAHRFVIPGASLYMITSWGVHFVSKNSGFYSLYSKGGFLVFRCVHTAMHQQSCIGRGHEYFKIIFGLSWGEIVIWISQLFLSEPVELFSSG